MVVARLERGGRSELIVAPVTHTKPEPDAAGVELPLKVKRQLGLDQAQSWIITTEFNRFIWPGPDVRIAPGKESPIYDAIPERLFEKLRESIASHVALGRLKVTKRSE